MKDSVKLDVYDGEPDYPKSQATESGRQDDLEDDDA